VQEKERSLELKLYRANSLKDSLASRYGDLKQRNTKLVRGYDALRRSQSSASRACEPLLNYRTENMPSYSRPSRTDRVSETALEAEIEDCREAELRRTIGILNTAAAAHIFEQDQSAARIAKLNHEAEDRQRTQADCDRILQI
jgi:hypothetical protein